MIRRALGSTSHELGTATVMHIGPVEKGSVFPRAEFDGLEVQESTSASMLPPMNSLSQSRERVAMRHTLIGQMMWL